MAEAEVDRSWIKIVALGIVGVLAAGFFAFRINAFRTDSGGDQLVVAVIAAVVWLALVLLQMFLVKSRYIAAELFAAQVLALTLPLYGPFSWYQVAAAAVLFITLLTGFSLGRTDIVNYVRIRFFRIGTRVLPIFITGVALFVTVYAVGILDTGKIVIPEKVLTPVLESLTPIMRQFIPGFSLEMTVDQALGNFVRAQIGEKVPDEFVATKVRETKDAVARTFKINLLGSDLVGHAISQGLTDRLSTLGPSFKIVVLIGLGLLLFLVIKGLAFLVNWIIILFAFALFRLLMVTNFFYLALEPQQKEVIVMK